ncbi:MAG: DinB family protein [Gemmatimonadaceae bacterium]
MHHPTLETTQMPPTDSTPGTPFMATEQFLEHWQGHRALTRRIIDAFPENDLFNYSEGGMRTFSALAMEMIGMAVPTLTGAITSKWPEMNPGKPTTKADLLALWDSTTGQINELWPQIPAARFQETDVAFGQWKMPIYGLFLYLADNEIHHRGQGFVYLRSLGIEPAPFYERS